MNRRDFIAATAATALLLPFAAHAASKTIRFTPGVVDDLLAQGKTVLVDFATDWCPTCRAQERNILALRIKNPAYNEHMVFVRVDWDIYSRSALSKRLNIPRRSTLVLLRGDQELGRNVANAGISAIRDLLDLGLVGV